MSTLKKEKIKTPPVNADGEYAALEMQTGRNNARVNS